MGKSLKGKELGKGITQRKDGRYQARYTNRFGQRKTLYANTYNEVVKKLRDEEYINGKKLNSCNSTMIMDKWYELWRDTFKKNTCRDTTLQTYDRIYTLWIAPSIGKMKLEDISQIHLQNIINSLQSKSMKEITKAVLSNMFKYAVSAELISKNVAYNLNARITEEDDKEVICLTDEELDIIMRYSKGQVINLIYRFALQTGMRVGEIIGLTWGNVDYENNIIHVVQQLVTIKDENTNKWVNKIHKPKSKAGIRDIPMTKETREILNEIRTRDNIIRLFKEDDYVFATKNNTPHFRASVSKMSDRVRDKIIEDYPEFRKFSPHSFRHTFATRMIMAGVKPKVLQKIMGHNQLQTTMDTYCHVYDEQLQEAMAIFENGLQMVYS